MKLEVGDIIKCKTFEDVVSIYRFAAEKGLTAHQTSTPMVICIDGKYERREINNGKK